MCIRDRPNALTERRCPLASLAINIPLWNRKLWSGIIRPRKLDKARFMSPQTAVAAVVEYAMFRRWRQRFRGRYALRSLGETSTGRIVYGENRPCGDSSSVGWNVYGRIAYGAKCPYMGRNVHGANCQLGEKYINRGDGRGANVMLQTNTKYNRVRVKIIGWI